MKFIQTLYKVIIVAVLSVLFIGACPDLQDGNGYNFDQQNQKEDFISFKSLFNLWHSTHHDSDNKTNTQSGLHLTEIDSFIPESKFVHSSPETNAYILHIYNSSKPESGYTTIPLLPPAQA